MRQNKPDSGNLGIGAYMLKQSNTLPSTKKKFGRNKLVMGFAALAATAVIGTTGVAAAAQPTKPTKEQCQTAGISNYGQCVKAWAQQKHGNGYGGNIEIDLGGIVIGGNNNVINVIINIFR